MKIEEAFKIQTEIKLLEAGFYDKEVYSYINSDDGNKQYEEDFSDMMWQHEISEGFHIKKSTGKFPSNEENRVWYFRRKMHPELFKEI